MQVQRFKASQMCRWITAVKMTVTNLAFIQCNPSNPNVKTTMLLVNPVLLNSQSLLLTIECVV